ncbi:hypothetical protein ATKI12_1646 [Kitasatospora sp. Ki12]|uniref:hypothetical protein n=1 Tax=Kitasatospora xanthocidica TaxID=83382 RepID=UPI0016781F91|nr:hypothetical protein [Kitasatospora xanthocidica]GHF30491.1 hypothetical protein GCM10018790_05070 [Kitasatospora xanthocidica]
MPTRQLRAQPPPTARPGPGSGGPDATDTSRDPVLLGDVLFHTLADLARRTEAPALPAQRTRPHP